MLIPPRSTLFPYTTLFRSSDSDENDWQVNPTGSVPSTAVNGTEPDRKSTRLNSSHSQISYAVFCLKEKTAPHVERRIQVGIDERILRYGGVVLVRSEEHTS